MERSALCQGESAKSDERISGPKQKWGPALLPAPTAPSEGSAGVRDLIRRSFTVLDPGSPAQASLPITAARESLAFSSFASRKKLHLGPLMLRPKTKQLRCSAALLGMITSASRFASPTEVLEAASRKRKIISSGASSRLAPDRPRRNSPLPAGRDRVFGHLPPEGGLRPLSRSPEHHAHRCESRKAKNVGASLWITGISGTTEGTNRDSPESPPAIA